MPHTADFQRLEDHNLLSHPWYTNLVANCLFQTQTQKQDRREDEAYF